MDKKGIWKEARIGVMVSSDPKWFFESIRKAWEETMVEQRDVIDMVKTMISQAAGDAVAGTSTTNKMAVSGLRFASSVLHVGVDAEKLKSLDKMSEAFLTKLEDQMKGRLEILTKTKEYQERLSIAERNLRRDEKERFEKSLEKELRHHYPTLTNALIMEAKARYLRENPHHLKEIEALTFQDVVSELSKDVFLNTIGNQLADQIGEICGKTFANRAMDITKSGIGFLMAGLDKEREDLYKEQKQVQEIDRLREESERSTMAMINQHFENEKKKKNALFGYKKIDFPKKPEAPGERDKKAVNDNKPEPELSVAELLSMDHAGLGIIQSPILQSMTRTLARKGPEALQSSILKELSLAKGKAKSELGVGDPLPELVKECMLAAQYVYGDQVKNGVLPLSVMAQYVKQGTEIALMKAGVDAREAKAMGELYGSMLNPTGLKPETSLKIALDVAFPTVGPCFMSKAYETKVITTYERLRDAQIMVGMKDRSWQENLNLINSSVRQDKAEWSLDVLRGVDIRSRDRTWSQAFNSVFNQTVPKDQQVRVAALSGLRYMFETQEGRASLTSFLDEKSRASLRDETTRKMNLFAESNKEFACWYTDDILFRNWVSHESTGELKGALIGTGAVLAGVIASTPTGLTLLGRMAVGSLGGEAVKTALIKSGIPREMADAVGSSLEVSLMGHLRSGSLAGVVAPADSVWLKPPVTRGQIIEKNLGHNTPPNCPVIDKLFDQTATSIKSLDLNAVTYQNPSQLKSVLKGYVNKMIGYEKGMVGTEEIKYGKDFTKKALDVAVPHSGNLSQQSIIKEIVDYGNLNSVQVNIIVYP
jgi:hypothetical protein